MYINLVLGAVAAIVLWLFLRRLLVREDTLRETPAELLEKEVAKRRALEEEAEKAFERLRDAGKERMRPVAAALDEIRSAMPAVVGEAAKEPRKKLLWDDEGDSVVIRIQGEDETEEHPSLVVNWRVPDLDIRKAARYGDDLPGLYVLRRSDPGQEERTASLDACVRAITAFIVDFMA